MVPSDPITPAPKRRRIPVSLALALAILVVPAIALANHQFNDVPTGASYHDEVESLVGAGITSGCGGANYCPGNAVTRGQMSQFMVRGLGSAVGGVGQIPASEAELFYVATLEITTGGLPGATGYVTVDADLSVLDFADTCPCAVLFWIEDTSGNDYSVDGQMVVPGDYVDGGTAANGSVSWVFEVPTGTDVEYGLAAAVFTETPVLSGPGTTGAPAEPMLTGTLTAEYSPFGEATLPPVGPKVPALDEWGGESIDRGREVQDR